MRFDTLQLAAEGSAMVRVGAAADDVRFLERLCGLLQRERVMAVSLPSALLPLLSALPTTSNTSSRWRLRRAVPT